MVQDSHGTAFYAVTPSPRTRHAELLRLCARIGYSPPLLACSHPPAHAARSSTEGQIHDLSELFPEAVAADRRFAPSPPVHRPQGIARQRLAHHHPRRGAFHL